MPFLSIIIPVYNTAPFLDDCLSSVLGQHFQDIEVICVNDGSTDETPNILRRWQQNDSRIVIINQENQGLSASRNNGLKIAKGEYVTFVDADDMVCEDIYTTSIETIKHHQLDAYIFGFKTYPDNKEHPTGFTTGKLLTPQELFSSCSHIQSKNSLCFCWRFVYRSFVLKSNNLFFDERIRIGEDMVFNIDAIFHSRCIMVSDTPSYIYRKDNAQSLMTSPFKKGLESSFTHMYSIKKTQIAKYHLSEFSDYPTDLNNYTIKTYLPLMIKNIYADPSKPDISISLHRILSMDMIKDAFSEIGFRKLFPSWKEYVFYLILKFRCTSIAKHYYDKLYGNIQSKP